MIQKHRLQRIMLAIVTILLATSSAAYAQESTAAQSTASHRQQCPEKIGRFNPAKDILFAHFDTKPDVDDLHAVAALGTILKHPRFACVRFMAVTGTVGTQDGAFIPAPRLFTLAFGKHWRDAQANWRAAMKMEVELAKAVLKQGGDIWIMEAGQSDFSAALLRHLAADKSRVHIVQHSNWNEDKTTPAALNSVRANSNYHKIADGNAVGNGTPGFNNKDGRLWPMVLADNRVGAMWREAKRLADLHNPKSVYVNPSVAAGGFDFSDAAEAAWIFGFEDMADERAFFAEFTGKN